MRASLSSLRIKLPGKREQPADNNAILPINIAALSIRPPEKTFTDFKEQLEKLEPSLNIKIFKNCGITLDELIAQVNSSGDLRQNRVQANRTKDGYQIFIFREKECYQADSTYGKSKFIKNKAILISINLESQVSFKKIVTLAQKSPLFKLDLRRRIDAKLITSGYQTATKL